MKKKEIFLQLQFYQKVKIYNSIQKEEFHCQKNYLITQKLKIIFYLLVLVKLFKYGNQKIFEKFKIVARKKAYQNRSNLKWENKQKGEQS